jgi:hypothetical protein
MTQPEREQQIFSDIAADQQHWWAEKTTRILPSEVPDWALKLAIITAIVLMLAR